MFTYEALEIWRLAIDYAKMIYRITNNFPKDELYGFVNQLRRAAISISANIAEGSGASGIKDKLNYLDIAIKSALETTSELQIAFELGYIDKSIRDSLYENAEKIIRKIRSYKKFLQTDNRLTIHYDLEEVLQKIMAGNFSPIKISSIKLFESIPKHGFHKHNTLAEILLNK